jgi:hypothetical protein
VRLNDKQMACRFLRDAPARIDVCSVASMISLQQPANDLKSFVCRS